MRTWRNRCWTAVLTALLLLLTATTVGASPDGPASPRDKVILATLHEADRHRKEGRVGAERALLEAVLRKDPSLSLLRIRLAGLLLRLRDLPGAKAHAGILIETGREKREALLIRGQILAAGGDVDGALRDYAAILATGAKKGHVADLKLARHLLEKAGFKGPIEDAAARDLFPIDWPYALAARHGEILRLLTKGPSWGKTFEKRSGHYRVRTDAGPQAALAVAVHLERARTAFDEVLPPATGSATPLATVLAFSGKKDYVTYLAGLAGSTRFLPSTSGMYMPDARLLAIHLRGRLDASLVTIYHEAFHLEVDRRLGPMPRWIDEGLADALGYRVVARDYRQSPDPTNHLRRLLVLSKAGARPGVRAVVSLPDAAFGDPKRAHDAYALSWVLADYLLERDERSRKQHVRALLRDLRRERSADHAVRLVLAGEKEPAVDAAFRKHVKRRLEARRR